MNRVTQSEFAAVVNRLPHEWAHPIEGTTICAMQYVAPDGDLLAQAVYNGGEPQYYVTERVTS